MRQCWSGKIFSCGVRELEENWSVVNRTFQHTGPKETAQIMHKKQKHRFSTNQKDHTGSKFYENLREKAVSHFWSMPSQLSIAI